MFDSLVFTGGRLIKRWVWRPLWQIGQIVHPLPLLTAFVIFLMLWSSGQLHELYFSYFEPPLDAQRRLNIAVAGVALALLSTALYSANYWLSTARIDAIYADFGNWERDVWLRRTRNLVGMIAAGLPWAGVAFGLWSAATQSRAWSVKLGAIANDLAPATAAISGDAAALLLLERPLEIAAGAAAVCGVIVVILLQTSRRSRIVSAVTSFVIIATIGALLVLPVSQTISALAHAQPATIDLVTLFRSLGPVAALTIVIACAFSLVAGVSLLASRVGFPVLSLTFLVFAVSIYLRWPVEFAAWILALGYLVIAALAFTSGERRLSALAIVIVFVLTSMAWQRPVAPSAPTQTAESLTLEAQFKAWITARQPMIAAFKAANRPYPVVIVAAQGGGIYAASATAAFLASVQERCTNFASHVFAISGVSGGAVGAAVFQSLLGDRPLSSHAGCSPDVRQNLASTSGAILSDDHLSPLLGMFLGDVITSRYDRAVALENSFTQSVMQRGQSQAFAADFANHWRPDRAAPALVLNATSVETGYRVVFAPFTLNGGRDGTLYAFHDTKLGAARQLANPNLAQAAVVSARFPGVAPAFVVHPDTGQQGRRLNFVDGGYADGSGAATGLDLYKALGLIIADINLKQQPGQEIAIDVRVVLLTDPNAQLDFEKVDGNAGRDTLAPIATLLKIRELLAKQAITRTIAEIEENATSLGSLVNGTWNETNSARKGSPDHWKVTTVELDTDAFKLALGWKISGTTQKLISTLMGSAELCNGPQPSTANALARRVRGNGCVAAALAALLTPMQPF